MWIYNLTAQVDLEIVEEWKGWLTGFVADKIDSSLFAEKPKLLWVRSQDSEDGQSFALQLLFESASALQKFLGHADGIIEKASQKTFQNKVLYFGSLLEELEWKS